MMSARNKYLFIGILLLCFVCIVGLYQKNNAGGPGSHVKVKWLYPPRYYRGTEFCDGRAWVQEEKNGPWSLLDDKGNTLRIGLRASLVDRYQDGIAHYFGPLPLDDSVWSWEPGFLDRSGDVVLSPDVYDGIEDAHGEGLIVRKCKKGLYGFIDITGTWIILPIYDFQPFPFKEGLASAGKDGKQGFIDKENVAAIDFEFDEARPFSHEMAPVRVGSKWGVIDQQGEWIAEPIYEKFCGPTWSNPIGLEKDGKVGFIGTKGDVVIDFQYPPKADETGFSVYCFNNGRASVILDDSDKKSIEYGVIDESGEVLFRRKGCELVIGENYILCLNEDGLYSIIDREWREYPFPGRFKFPPTVIGLQKNDIFKFTDIERNRTGYFTISVNPN